jgi:hypothetical protein
MPPCCMQIAQGWTLKNTDFPADKGDSHVAVNCYDTVDIEALRTGVGPSGLVAQFRSL